MIVRLTGIALTSLHGSLRNVRILGPDGVELPLTESVANSPAITLSWGGTTSGTDFEGHDFHKVVD